MTWTLIWFVMNQMGEEKELKSTSPESMVCWVTCMCLPNTGVGTREAPKARSQMKELTGHGLGYALQRIKKVYLKHKYSQKELDLSPCREQLEYRLGFSSQKSGWGRFRDSQVLTLMPVHDSDTQRCTRINSKLRPSHDAHHDAHEVLSSVWIRSNSFRVSRVMLS